MHPKHPEETEEERNSEFSPEAMLGQLLGAEQAKPSMHSMAFRNKGRLASPCTEVWRALNSTGTVWTCN